MIQLFLLEEEKGGGACFETSQNFLFEQNHLNKTTLDVTQSRCITILPVFVPSVAHAY